MKMKRILTLFCSVALVMGLCGTAAAVPYQWTDVVDPTDDVYFSSARQGGVQSFTYVHEIWDGADGFMAGKDLVTSYSLTIGLYDDESGDSCEWVFVNLPGTATDGIYEVSYTDIELGFSMRGRAMLNESGELSVELVRLAGDFYFVDSTLVASGDKASPVPEPATLFLLGVGLLGIGLLTRRKTGD